MTNPYATQHRASLENAPAQNAEGWALIESARRLDVSRADPVDGDTVLTAVRLNWRIWTIIQAALVDPDCPLPRQIRENLLNLSNFIDKRSAFMIANPKSVEKLDVLININRQIGAGLLGNTGDSEAPEESASEPAKQPRTPVEPTPSTALQSPSAAASDAYAARENPVDSTSKNLPLGRPTSTEV